MAARKKRQTSATAELDEGWKAVIAKSIKKRPTKAAWPDPKPAKPKKKKKKPAKKAK
jgi:hypothetical protein